MRLGNPRDTLAQAYKINRYGGGMDNTMIKGSVDAAAKNLGKIKGGVLAAFVIKSAEDQSKERVNWLRAAYDPHVKTVTVNAAINSLYVRWLKDPANQRVNRETCVRVSQMAEMILKEARCRIMSASPLYSSSMICHEMAKRYPVMWVHQADKMNFHKTLAPHWESLYGYAHDLDMQAIQPVVDALKLFKTDVA